MSEAIQVEVPTVGESISEVQIGQWLKAEGDWVNSGEDLVEIETEKASVQIPAPASGFLRNISKQEEEFANVGDVIAAIEPGEKPAEVSSGASSPAAPSASSQVSSPEASGFVMPAAQRLLDEHGLSASQVPARGPGGRLLKEDVLAFVREQKSSPALPTPPTSRSETSLVTNDSELRGEEIKPLSMLRRTIAARLVEAQQTAALLTTFNEIDMDPVMKIRKSTRINSWKDTVSNLASCHSSQKQRSKHCDATLP